MPPPTLTFALSTSFFATPVSKPLISAARPPAHIITHAAPTAVLDTPASNTYLQRHAEVVLRNFLTRRAVNTVMYYMQEMHDSPSRDFLIRFDDFGTKVKNDKFNDGDGYLDRMLREQNKRITVHLGHPRFARKFQLTIKPNHIAKRIMQSRMQLAAEWARDLRCIDAENLELQRLAFEKMLCATEAELNSKRNLIFDSDPFSNDHTPLRYKNYIALKTLTTQHAVARLLPYTRDRGSNHEYMYLLQFVSSYGAIKDGDEFLRALMDRPLESRTNPVYTIHPRSIALQILELRSAIAAEWIAVMEYIPEEQRLMNRAILERSINVSEAPGEDFPKRGNKKMNNGEAKLDKGEADEES